MRMLRKLLFLAFAAAALGAAAFRLKVQPLWRTWGVDAVEATKPLPGDDVVPEAPVRDTRAITIDAPPAAVWPWLLQMGFGRGGWYSYDAVDMRGASVDRILPEHQALAVGDTVPTHPGGGFLVKAVEPERALVLYLDSGLARAQAEAARAASAEASPPNVAAAGAFMGATSPTEFAASWAFVLEPEAGGRTRLIERFRVRFEQGGQPWTRVTLPVLGFGVFAMVRRQLLGIRARAEQSERRTGAAA